MAQRSRFFDSSGGDRVYASAAWAEIVGGLTGDGVVSQGNELAVSEASPPAMSVRVNTGKAFVRGYYFEVHAAQETLAIAAADPTNPRIDRVVVRRDLAGRTAILAVLAGTPAGVPAAPGLTQVEAGIWEISLARVAVAAAASSIVNANITDERGARSQGPDITNLETELTDPTTGHRHEGTAGTGRKVRHSDTDAIGATDHHPAPDAGPHADIDIDFAGAAGAASTFARSGHGHRVNTTVGPGADVTADGAGATGDTTTVARGLHGHKVNTTAGPGADVAVEAAGAAGATGAVARAGHGHKLNQFGGPMWDVSNSSESAGAPGTAPARGDHVHRLVSSTAGGGLVQIDAAAQAGTDGTAPSRSDHGHRLNTHTGPMADVSVTEVAGTSGAAPARGDHIHSHGSGYMPDAHHAKQHALGDGAAHTGSAADINGWVRASAGGGTAGDQIWVGTTDPGAAASEGDVWIKA